MPTRYPTNALTCHIDNFKKLCYFTGKGSGIRIRNGVPCGRLATFCFVSNRPLIELQPPIDRTSALPFSPGCVIMLLEASIPLLRPSSLYGCLVCLLLSSSPVGKAAPKAMPLPYIGAVPLLHIIKVALQDRRSQSAPGPEANASGPGADCMRSRNLYDGIICPGCGPAWGWRPRSSRRTSGPRGPWRSPSCTPGCSPRRSSERR